MPREQNASTRRAWLANPFDPVPGAPQRSMRYEGLADALVEAGWDVVWFTADFDHMTRRFRVPRNADRVAVRPGLRLEYVHVPAYRTTFGLRRILSHGCYARGLRRRMDQLAAETPDVIVASVPLLGAVRASLAHRARFGGAVVADVQDLWPEALASAMPAGLRPAYLPVRDWMIRAERRALASCDAITAVSHSYLRERMAIGRPTHCAYLGVDLQRFDETMRAAHIDPARRPPPRDGLRVLWTGTIRPAADLKTVIDAAAILKGRRVPARFLIAGDGPGRPALEAFARRAGVGPDTVEFLGAFPESHRPAIAQRSHVGLNAYVTDCANSVTTKFFDYQASGLAILNSVAGEPADLIRMHGMGTNYVAGDAVSLAQALEAMARSTDRVAAMGRAARRFAERHGSRKAIAACFVEFLETLVTGKRPPRLAEASQ